MTAIPLDNQPKAQMLRVSTKSKAPKSVDREGGDFGAGLIRGLSAITKGEALGHGLWIDDVFLDQVGAALQASDKAGIKSRFTHPDLSADGLAKFLGRVKTGRVEGGQVFTDLHLAKSAHKSPDGDLAGYVLDRTEEDPGSFGASIVFYRDLQQEAEFELSHGAELNEDGYLDRTKWKSPDPDNVNNYRHARLATLDATDLVDDPAANPNGMFHRGPIAEIGRLADFALGISDETPSETTALDVDPDRFKNWVERYLENRGLQIVEIEKADDTVTETETDPDDSTAQQQPTDPPPPETSVDLALETGPDRDLSAYCEAFGHAAGAQLFLAGTKFADAQTAQLAELKAENERLRAQAELAAKEQGTPLNLPQGSKKSLRDLTRIRSAR